MKGKNGILSYSGYISLSTRPLLSAIKNENTASSMKLVFSKPNKKLD